MTPANLESLAEFARIRLFVGADLGPSMRVDLTREQRHYLRGVMRLGDGEEIRLFNGRDGEWSARILGSSREAVAETIARLRDQDGGPDVTLAFAPIKKSPMKYLVEKATELGVRRLQPILTSRTQVRQINEARMRAQTIEAAEQSWRLSVPEIGSAVGLDPFLEGWSGDPILYCDERRARDVESPLETLREVGHRLGPWAILIGPEGGFSPEEQAKIEALPNALGISLGPRIVRAETAAVMALTLWQAVFGDLKGS